MERKGFYNLQKIFLSEKRDNHLLSSKDKETQKLSKALIYRTRILGMRVNFRSTDLLVISLTNNNHLGNYSIQKPLIMKIHNLIFSIANMLQIILTSDMISLLHILNN